MTFKVLRGWASPGGFAVAAGLVVRALRQDRRRGAFRWRRTFNQARVNPAPEDLGWTSDVLQNEEVRGQLNKALEHGGTQGKALRVGKEFPSRSEVMAVIPKDCFEKNTAVSLMYAASSVLQVAACAYAGWRFIPLTLSAWPLWSLYSIVCGTCATGAWVVAHECGHDAFCNQKWLQTSVGYVLHSAMLAPYYSWQRSHAVHHAKTNHLTEGETHVPKVRDQPRSWEKMAGVVGRTPVAILRLFVRLVFGWPAYLLFGSSGGPAYGRTSHMWPYAPFNSGEKELFPGRHKKKVLKADVGMIVVLSTLWYWGHTAGWASVAALYGAPLLVANAWLVLYTWLQHTDVDVPHYGPDTWNWGKGAFSTIDRPYGALVDFLHHRIGSTHVAHHVNCTIPHYKAVKATKALKENFPDFYLYDPTPIPLAMWRVVRNCFRVKQVPGPDGMHIFATNR